MREILFRGKRTDNGAWCYGNYQNVRASNGRLHYIATDESTYSIYPDTLGQYTGLTDVNGTRIFEGDIVKYRKIICDIFMKTRIVEEFTDEVVFSNGSYSVKHDSISIADLVIDKNPQPNVIFLKNCEVVGNVHDQAK